jgi:NAD(P)-dependent dehydrogenase (short-subunit alcohol dehydrogenase family)
MFKDNLLENKHVLITGGGTGLGKSMGRHFMELGANLSICGRRQAVLEDTASEHEAATSRQCRTFACDIRDIDAVEAMINDAEATQPVDILINNAAGNILARSEDLSPRAIDAVIGIVQKGALNCTLGLGKRWLDAGRPGTVLSIITPYAWTGSAYVLPSAVAKAGVLAMTRSLAVEWGGRGIRLNAVAPGPFPTEGAWDRLVPKPELAHRFETRNPLGRPGDHVELANLAAFLISDMAAYINGDCVTIDGGDWLKGAGQFTSLGDALSDEDWQAMKPAKKGE